MIRPIAFAVLAAALAVSPALAEQPMLVETPQLAELVAGGALPPITERVPLNPAVVTFDGEATLPGQQGGELDLLMASARDTRMMTVYCYTRLVAYTPDFQIVPDLLADMQVEQGRIFTLVLREGHKWSDGQPFTAEDFRYFWEDVALDEEVTPTGPPPQLIVDGELPKFEVLDDHTVRYSWSAPNPLFLPALAGTSPLYIYRPAHYLGQFHAKHADPAALAQAVADSGQQNWVALHNKLDNQYRNDNPDLPTLDPWMLLTRPPADRFVFERNPYYHRVDEQGHQLPYIDRVVITITSGDLVAAKTSTGESDLQARNLSFSDAPLLKQGEAQYGYAMRLWPNGRGSQVALYPNLNVVDPVWRALMRDVRFRRALSLGVDRSDINAALYFGLGVEGNNTVLPESPLYQPQYTTQWASFDPDQANQLLDEIGLTQRDDRGVRLLPDGRALEIIVEGAGESSEESDVLELIAESWRALGIKLHIRTDQREVLRNRIFAGETMMAVWSGLDNGVPTPDMNPAEFAPVMQISLQWPMWGQYFETKGAAGEPVDLDAAKQLLELYTAWTHSTEPDERAALWSQLLQIHADEVFTIGTVAHVPQPVVVRNALHNIPIEGIYNWEPGAFFGIYRPETFWFDSGS